ncbi:MAG TPA: RtcB family protein, partial [Bacteroidales bacterium]|nr:RtcB family protein [Bacteroidales bacterium]
NAKKAKQEYEKFVKQNFPKSQWNTKLREFANQYSQKKQDTNLAYLEYEDMYNYLVDMIFVQEYASINRKTMMDRILKSLDQESIEDIECVHNYINFDDWIIRKGAISAHDGEVILIPLNMKDGMLVCKGKGNPEWNYSAPHGAGRILSRSKAKKDLDYELEKESMKGIYTTCIPLDEAPSAYKDSKIIEQNIGDTCDIINRILPIINIKGA